MEIRRHGDVGPMVIVLHGGPGAPGSASGLARGLADRFRVLEPMQRGSGDGPLSVARHVADLDDLLRTEGGGARVPLVGSSWGAMLALAWAAEHPADAGPLVLVGPGTFDLDARGRLVEILEARKGSGRVYDYDPIPGTEEGAPFDEVANRETWDDMVRLQGEGVYPRAFAAITSPVLMLHGAFDPHPGAMIRDGLLPHIPQLEYREWERCGHYPWIERHAREEFFVALGDWLLRHVAS